VEHKDREVREKVPKFHKLSLKGHVSPRAQSPRAVGFTTLPLDVLRTEEAVVNDGPVYRSLPVSVEANSRSGSGRQPQPQSPALTPSSSAAGAYFDEFRQPAAAPSVVPWFQPVTKPLTASSKGKVACIGRVCVVLVIGVEALPLFV
jgi:hypothetical protein